VKRVQERVSQKKITINESKIYFVEEEERIITLEGTKVSPICLFQNDSMKMKRVEFWF
jgi:hypothetical protein